MKWPGKGPKNPEAVHTRAQEEIPMVDDTPKTPSTPTTKYGYRAGMLEQLKDKAANGENLIEVTVPFMRDGTLVVRVPTSNAVAWMLDNVLGAGLEDTKDYKISNNR